MKVKHRGKRVLGWALGGSLVGALALFSGRFLGFLSGPASMAHASAKWVGDESGALVGFDDEGKPTQAFPLKHTDVFIQVSGPLARAQVTQQFENPYSDKIEAVYTFPLPQTAAVDDMTLTVGDRVVKGLIKKREEARVIY
jgi:Ca-activated chloride channel family protein